MKKYALKLNLFFFNGVKGHATNKKNEAVKNRKTGYQQGNRIFRQVFTGNRSC
jgi:hypothetical protein